MMQERILIICNKNFEADALLSALLNSDFRHPDLSLDEFGIRYPVTVWTKKQQGEPSPRLLLCTSRYQFEIWCIQSVMTPNPDPRDSYYFSKSIQKARDFYKILDFDKEKSIHAVFAFGTAGIPSEISRNGSIVIGSNVFVYDASPELPADQRYFRPEFGQVIPSTIGNSFFDQLTMGFSTIKNDLFFEKRYLPPPNNPFDSFHILADKSIVAISDVNVKSYADYKTADKAALNAFQLTESNDPAFSIETTHGLIRLECDATNFVFITAVTDRDSYFDTEVTPRAPAQNFACAFNGGVFISWLIPFINRL